MIKKHNPVESFGCGRMENFNRELLSKYENETKECLKILNTNFPKFNFYPRDDGTWMITCAENAVSFTYEWILLGEKSLPNIRKQMKAETKGN